VDRIVAQAMGRGAILVRDEVSRVDYQDPAFTITGGDGIYWSRAVILAVGLAPRPIDIPGTRAAGDRLVSYWLDLPDVNGRRVAVIGGGEVALDQAGSIAQKGGRVAVLVRSSRPRAFPGLVRDIQALGVDVKTRAPVRRMDRTSGGLALIVGSETDPWIMETDFVVASIGAGPALVPVTPEAEARAGRGLFRAGDLIDPQYRQAAIAGGDGLKKAMMVQEYLEAEEAKWTS
jgi:thioredoxin reductase (NADPH)